MTGCGLAFDGALLWAISVAETSLDAFNLEIPDGTPVRRQSAFEQLSGVATAFSRLPAFTQSLTTRTHH